MQSLLPIAWPWMPHCAHTLRLSAALCLSARCFSAGAWHTRHPGTCPFLPHAVQSFLWVGQLPTLCAFKQRVHIIDRPDGGVTVVFALTAGHPYQSCMSPHRSQLPFLFLSGPYFGLPFVLHWCPSLPGRIDNTPNGCSFSLFHAPAGWGLLFPRTGFPMLFPL